jgi:glucose/arabinose dehydrogenase
MTRKTKLLAALLFLTLACRGDVEARPPSTDQLSLIRLPPGFSIAVFAADVPNARQMTISPEGTLYVGTRRAGKVYAIPGAVAAATEGKPTTTPIVLASGLTQPNGVAFKDGSLYVAEVSRVLRFDKVESRLTDKNPAYTVVRDDYPTDEHHGWKYIAIGPDGWLYVPVGAPCNLCVRDDEPAFASITRMTLDGKTREIWARGIRNSVGFDWHPKTGALWFTENGSDNLGDDFPGDELNIAPTPGLHFGYPHCHNGPHPDRKFGNKAACVPGGPYAYPAQVLAPHTAALGMKFYRGAMFPDGYRGRVLIAEHGSWNRTTKIGYRVTMAVLDGDKVTSYTPFAEGWLQSDGAWGRPVDVLELPDGSVLVSDDHRGCIYRISYRAPAP